MSRRRRILIRLHTGIIIRLRRARHARRPLCAARPRRRIQRRSRRLRGFEALFERVDAGALLSVLLGFLRSVRVYAAFGEEVGASACDDEGRPAVAVGSVSCVALLGWE